MNDNKDTQGGTGHFMACCSSISDDKMEKETAEQ